MARGSGGGHPSGQSAAFGDQLRHYRELAGLSQEQLAERAGLSAKSIGLLERGERRRPFPHTLDVLARALGLSMTERQALVGSARGRPTPFAPGQATVGTVALPGPGARNVPGADEAAAPGQGPHNLPAELSSFIGREAELARVARLVADHRLVILTGAGGCGKTRLALQAARELVPSFPEGVCLVELAPLADGSLLASAVLAALGTPERQDQDSLATLIGHLRSRAILIVLDNCEHLVAPCARVVEALLAGCPRLHVLATSRERLALTGELTWRVPSLSLPPEQASPSVSSLVASEAGALFAARAAAVAPDFAVTPDNAAAIAQIVRQLDGIPLAIELAAARVRALAPEQIAARLDDRFRLLTGGSRTALPRQQTLRATVDWSYALLSEAERTLLGRASVFAGGFDLEAAEAVCPDGDPVIGRLDQPSARWIPPDSILDLLFQLVDKSLVIAERHGSADRYRLLETIRQYAGEMLEPAGEAPAARARHAAYYGALAARARAQLAGPQQVRWTERLEADQDNLRAALRSSLDGDAATGLQLAGDLGSFWRYQGAHREGRRWLEEALARPVDAAGDPAHQRAATVARAYALRMAGLLAIDQGDYAPARAFLAESVARFRALEDEPGVANALMLLAYVVVGDDRDRALRMWDECLRLARKVNGASVFAAVFEYLGLLAAVERDLPRARSLIEEALGARRQLGGTWLIARSHEDLGVLAFLEGDLVRAREQWQEALRLARSLRDRRIVGPVYLHLARLARAEGDAARAIALVRESVRSCEEMGTWLAYAGLTFLGTLLIENDRPVPGIRLHAAAAGRTRRDLIWFWVDDAIREWGAILGPARSALGEDAFARAWAEGRAMTREQAVADALEEGGG